MTINTDHLDSCARTLGSSLDRYRQAQLGSIDQEIFRNAIIKGYELTQETGFKLLKRALQDYIAIPKANGHQSLQASASFRRTHATGCRSVCGNPGLRHRPTPASPVKTPGAGTTALGTSCTNRINRFGPDQVLLASDCDLVAVVLGDDDGRRARA